jgi:hypothetical protein
VRDAISGHRALAGDLTDSRHDDSSRQGRPGTCAGPKNESRFIPAEARLRKGEGRALWRFSAETSHDYSKPRSAKDSQTPSPTTK